MSVSTTTAASFDKSSVFWGRLWRSSGIQSVSLFVVAYAVYGYGPQFGTLVGISDGRTLGVIASVLFGLAILNLMWFAAAIRSTLSECGRDGWGAAATASSAAVGVLFLLLTALSVMNENGPPASGTSNLAWVCLVVSSYPRAMLIMAGSFGLWRAKLMSNALFGVCVAAVVLVVAGGATLMSAGFWAPDGVYSRLVSPLIGVAWVLIVTPVLLRAPATRTGW